MHRIDDQRMERRQAARRKQIEPSLDDAPNYAVLRSRLAMYETPTFFFQDFFSFVKHWNLTRFSCLGLEKSTHLLRIILKQNNYVLTTDFALKLLIIHERMKASMGTILCGETGVGKVYDVG